MNFTFNTTFTAVVAFVTKTWKWIKRKYKICHFLRQQLTKRLHPSRLPPSSCQHNHQNKPQYYYEHDHNNNNNHNIIWLRPDKGCNLLHGLLVERLQVWSEPSERCMLIIIRVAKMMMIIYELWLSTCQDGCPIAAEALLFLQSPAWPILWSLTILKWSSFDQ